MESWLYCTIHLSLFHSALGQYKELARFPFKFSSKSVGARGSRTMYEATTETPLLHQHPLGITVVNPPTSSFPAFLFPAQPPTQIYTSLETTVNATSAAFLIPGPLLTPRDPHQAVSLLWPTKGLQWGTRVPPGSASWQPSSRTELLEPVPCSQRVNGRNFSGLATSSTPRGPNPTLGGLV